MPFTSEEKARKRYRAALERGEEPPPPRTAANIALLSEVREEVERALKGVQAAAHAGQEAVRRQTRKGKAEITEATTQKRARAYGHDRGEGRDCDQQTLEGLGAGSAC